MLPEFRTLIRNFVTVISLNSSGKLLALLFHVYVVQIFVSFLDNFILFQSDPLEMLSTHLLILTPFNLTNQNEDQMTGMPDVSITSLLFETRRI
jgi:hypothetical protein